MSDIQLNDESDESGLSSTKLPGPWFHFVGSYANCVRAQDGKMLVASIATEML